MLRLFTENNEKMAKNLANSFIGSLDRKYDKQNFGVVANYETAMNCWCEGLKNGDHISITSNEDTYLIRNQKINRIMGDNTSVNRFVVSQVSYHVIQFEKHNSTGLECFTTHIKQWRASS